MTTRQTCDAETAGVTGPPILAPATNIGSLTDGAPARRSGKTGTGRIRSRRRSFSQSRRGLIARRLMMSIPLLAVVTMFSFVLVSLTPGDAAQQILGVNATPDALDQLRRNLGLDRPVLEQYWHWVAGVFQGDLGMSIFSGQSVSEAIEDRLPVTLSLIAVSLAVTVLVGISAGVFSAVRGGVAARIVDAVGLVGFSLPSFWIGAVLIGIFAVELGLVPATGYVPFSESPGEWAVSLILPVAALSLHSVTAVARQTREVMLDILGSEYIRMARANGIALWSLIGRHAMKNAGIRVVTILGLQTIGLLGGTVLVESVFALPGLGGMAVEASVRKDLPVIQGVAFLFTLMVIVINVVIDLAYSWLNPKVDVR